MDMKPILFSTPLMILGALIQTTYASERILDVHRGVEITRKEMIEMIAKADELVVGEKHNTESIQNSEARLFSDFASSRGERVTFAWEFWDWSDKAKLDASFEKFRTDEITSEAFLKSMFGDQYPNLPYAPLMEAVKAAQADILPTNLSRSEKAPVLKGGINALDPKLLPPGFGVGGANYYERFVEAMGGHSDPAKSENYFVAQSLVDDSVALHLTRDRTTRSIFLVIGEFHSSYFDGVWKRLELRSGNHTRYLVQIADPEDQTDWEPVLHHAKYGDLADFVIFTR